MLKNEQCDSVPNIIPVKFGDFLFGEMRICSYRNFHFFLLYYSMIYLKITGSNPSISNRNGILGEPIIFSPKTMSILYYVGMHEKFLCTYSPQSNHKYIFLIQIWFGKCN